MNSAGEHGVPHARCGKLIVAADESEIAQLEALYQRGTANGVEGLVMVDRAFVAGREPNIRAAAAIFSPETGIVDAEALVKTLLRVGEAAGVIFLPGTKLVGAERQPGRHRAPHRARNHSRGHDRQRRRPVCGRCVEDARRRGVHDLPVRGEYAELVPAKRSLVNALVYPLPHAAGHGLGVHVTKSTGGNVWFGPTVHYQERKDDYESDRLPVEGSSKPAKQLLPMLTVADLRLSGSGIRPKLHPASESFADFMIRRDRENPRVVHAAGIESPGLTSCLAIGEWSAIVRSVVGRSSS